MDFRAVDEGISSRVIAAQHGLAVCPASHRGGKRREGQNVGIRTGTILFKVLKVQIELSPRKVFVGWS